MKTQNYYIKSCLLALSLTSFSSFAAPILSFTALTPTNFTLPASKTATVKYLVKNMSKKSHSFSMLPIAGVTQITSAGSCNTIFALGAKHTCILTLEVSGANLSNNITTGPKVCEQGNSLQCYQPFEENQLHITLASTQNQTYLSASVSKLAISVNDITINPALSGTPRRIRISNSGLSPAFNVTYNLSKPLPDGSSITPASCGTIHPANSCVLTITPGVTPSAEVGDRSSTPINLEIKGENTNTISTLLDILSYGSIYESGYVFSIDDTIPDLSSVHVKTLTLEDLVAPNPGIIWSSKGTGAKNDDVSNDYISGITEVSIVPCVGASEGQCNTDEIVHYYFPPRTNPPVNLKYYATGLCKFSIAGHTDWYLPAICEMGYDGYNLGSGCGTKTDPTVQNIQSNLIDRGIVTDLHGDYWSSSEYSANPTYIAWYNNFASSGSVNSGAVKSTLLGVRCIRNIT